MLGNRNIYGKSASCWRDLISSIVNQGRGLLDIVPRRAREHHQAGLIDLANALLSSVGEASGVVVANEFLVTYRAANEADRFEFFHYLSKALGVNKIRLGEAVRAYDMKPDAEAASRLFIAAEPRRQELLRRLNLAPSGTEGLVRMREDLLAQIKNEQSFLSVDKDFQHLFGSWFNRGFLVLQRIDWDTPAAILEKIIQYEAVHTIRDWHDLRRRTDPRDRRLYAFFHPALVDEPLIFVEVALTSELPTAIEPILAECRDPINPDKATTAVFYSISNCQKGLKGVSFGNFLIKQVVQDLVHEFPNLRSFVTLSPIPGFKRWLESSAGAKVRSTVSKCQATVLSGRDDLPALELAGETVMPIIAQYLANAKTVDGRPVDPVARFHLGNGARLERINWMADLSEQGIQQSIGVMANYMYILKDIEKNHEAFANQGDVALGPYMHSLLSQTSLEKEMPHDPLLLEHQSG